MTDPVKEAVERLDRAAKLLDDKRAALIRAGDLRAVLSELSRLSRLVEEAGEALGAADDALTCFTTFEDDARYIMGNTNFALVQLRREQVKAARASLTHKAIRGGGDA